MKDKIISVLLLFAILLNILCDPFLVYAQEIGIETYQERKLENISSGKQNGSNLTYLRIKYKNIS